MTYGSGGIRGNSMTRTGRGSAYSRFFGDLPCARRMHAIVVGDKGSNAVRLKLVWISGWIWIMVKKNLLKYCFYFDCR